MNLNVEEFLNALENNEIVYITQKHCSICHDIEKEAYVKGIEMPNIFEIDMSLRNSPGYSNALQKISSLYIDCTPALVRGEKVWFPKSYEDFINCLGDLEAC